MAYPLVYFPYIFLRAQNDFARPCIETDYPSSRPDRVTLVQTSGPKEYLEIYAGNRPHILPGIGAKPSPLKGYELLQVPPDFQTFLRP